MPAQWGCVGIQGLPLRGGDGGPTGPYLEGGSSSYKKKKKKKFTVIKLKQYSRKNSTVAQWLFIINLSKKKRNGQDKMLIDNV